jgi:hydroxymethylbilane synthase
MTATTSSDRKIVRLGTRKSNLAMAQTYWVRDKLQQQFPNYEFEIKSMSTQGDKILDVSLSKIGDKGLFTK